MTTDTKRLRVCLHCGSVLLPEGGEWACYADECELNREALAAAGGHATLAVVVRFTMAVVRLCLVGGLVWLLVRACA